MSEFYDGRPAFGIFKHNAFRVLFGVLHRFFWSFPLKFNLVQEDVFSLSGEKYKVLSSQYIISQLILKIL